MLIDPVERWWMFSHWLTLNLFSLKWHLLQRSLLTVVNYCAGDSVCAIELRSYWSELNLYRSELKLYWSELRLYWSDVLVKDLQQFVVKWLWRCVSVNGTKVVPSGTLEILSIFVVVLCWYWSGQFVVKWSWIWVEVSSLLVEIFAEQPLVFWGYLVQIGE